MRIGIANEQTLKLAILKNAAKLINELITEAAIGPERTQLPFQLNEWKTFNIMPQLLQEKIYTKLAAELNQVDNEVIAEFKEFFPLSASGLDPIMTHARNSLQNYRYPAGRITETPREIVLPSLLSLESDQFVAALKALPRYTRDNQGNHQHTLISLLQQELHSQLITKMLQVKSQLRDYLTSSLVLYAGRIMDIFSSYAIEHGRSSTGLENLELFVAVIGTLITSIIKDGSGYCIDDSFKWAEINNILNIIPQERRVAIVSATLPMKDNNLRRERLLDNLPEYQQIMIRYNAPPTTYNIGCSR